MKYLCICFSLILLFTYEVNAHPGATDANGCHHCRGETCDKYGMESNFYHTHVNGQSVACPFHDPESSNMSDSYYYEEIEDTDEFIRNPINHADIKPSINNDDNIDYTSENSSPSYGLKDKITDFIGIGLLLFFIFVAIVSSIKQKQNTNEIDTIRKDFYENKEKYLNKNNPYTKTKVKDVNDYIKYKLEYNKRHKND